MTHLTYPGMIPPARLDNEPLLPPAFGGTRPKLIAAEDDVAAIMTWLREFEDSPNTLINYRKEAGRLLMWAGELRQKGLVQPNREDLLDY